MGAAAIWTAPVVTSMVARAAAGTPPPCACTGFGTGVFGAFTSSTPEESGSGSGGTSNGAKDCDQNLSFANDQVSISVQGTCGEFDALTCTARADFGDGESEFSLVVFGFSITGKLIASEITTSACACDVRASTTAIGVVVDPPGEETPPIPADVSVPGTTIGPLVGPLGTVSITLNHQFCDMATGESVVQGMVIRGEGAGEEFEGDTGIAILAESRVKTPGCPGFCPA